MGDTIRGVLARNQKAAIALFESVRASPDAWDGLRTGADWLLGNGADGRKAISYLQAPVHRLPANELRKHAQVNADPRRPRFIGFMAV